MDIEDKQNNPVSINIIALFGDANFLGSRTGNYFEFYINRRSLLSTCNTTKAEVDHISLTGKWKAPGGNDSTYYNLTEANYKDASGNNIGDFHRGFCIDGDAPPFGTSGSNSATHT